MVGNMGACRRKLFPRMSRASYLQDGIGRLQELGWRRTVNKLIDSEALKLQPTYPMVTPQIHINGIIA